LLFSDDIGAIVVRVEIMAFAQQVSHGHLRRARWEFSFDSFPPGCFCIGVGEDKSMLSPAKGLIEIVTSRRKGYHWYCNPRWSRWIRICIWV